MILGIYIRDCSLQIWHWFARVSFSRQYPLTVEMQLKTYSLSITITRTLVTWKIYHKTFEINNKNAFSPQKIFSEKDINLLFRMRFCWQKFHLDFSRKVFFYSVLSKFEIVKNTWTCSNHSRVRLVPFIRIAVCVFLRWMPLIGTGGRKFYEIQTSKTWNPHHAERKPLNFEKNPSAEFGTFSFFSHIFF